MQLASTLQHHVEFVGSLARSDVAQLMATTRCLVVPSLWQEPFGIVALEALASGCTVIASRIGGLTEAGGPYASYFPR